MTPKQLIASLNIHPKHARDSKVAIVITYALLFLIFPVGIVLVIAGAIIHELANGSAASASAYAIAGIVLVCAELIAANLIARLVVEPRTKVGDYRVIREVLQAWAGIVLLMGLMIWAIWGMMHQSEIYKICETLFPLHSGWVEAKASNSTSVVILMVLRIVMTVSIIAGICVWLRGFYQIKHMLSSRRIHGHEAKDIFQ